MITNESIEKDNFTQNHKAVEFNSVFNFKVILIGGIAVGKTSILKRYVENDFSSSYKCNIGVEYKVKAIVSQDNSKVNLKLWDTCGDEKYRGVTSQYYRDAHGIVLVYDITQKDTFTGLKDWINDIRNNAPADSVIIMVGNKEDLAIQRQVYTEDAQNWANDQNIFYFTECSAKTGNNIPGIFEKMAEEMVKIYKTKFKKNEPKDNQIHLTKKSVLSAPDPIVTNTSKCC